MHGDFTWIDLSTFDPEKAKQFYSKVFAWSYSADTRGYLTCMQSGQPSAGLYEMPEFFQKINMPSFWMSYIQVENIDGVVARANELGGKVELEEENNEGKVALIRDPLGAGFTCYEGAAKSGLTSAPQAGRWFRSELFISDLSKVEDFYRGLFGWKIEDDGSKSDRYTVKNSQAQEISAIQVASNDIRGDKEFWAVFIGVSDIQKAVATIEDLGGTVIYDYQNATGNHRLILDNQDAAFFISEADTRNTSIAEETKGKDRFKWRSIVGLVGVYLAVLLEANWVWGVIFLFWVIPDLKSGTTHFIESINKVRNPVLYWAIVITWIGLAVYLLAEPLFST